ncbi:MAG TPA: hypothetical protein VGM88_19770 [Kofleriaceae bacterium]|jgi:hypothetical protein
MSDIARSRCVLAALAVVLLNAQEMDGPFPTPFSDECALLLADGGTCERVERLPVGPLAVEVWRSDGYGYRRTWIAMGSGDHWLRSHTIIEPARSSETRHVLALRDEPDLLVTLSLTVELAHTRKPQIIELSCRVAADRSEGECGTPKVAARP